MKACTHCGSTKFGLIRYRIGTLPILHQGVQGSMAIQLPAIRPRSK